MKHVGVFLLTVLPFAMVGYICWEWDVGGWLRGKPAAPLPRLPIRDEPANDGAEPRVALRVQYPAGRYLVVNKNHSVNTMTAEGRDEEGVLKKRNDSWHEIAVSSPDADGITTIVSRMRRGAYYRSPCRGHLGLDIDSDRPATLAGSFEGELMKLKLAKPTVVLLDRNLTVVGTRGFDEVINMIRALAPEAGTILDDDPEAIAKRALSGGGPTQNYLPGESVGVGAVWYAEFETKAKAVSCWRTLAKCRLKELAEVDGIRLAKIDYVKREWIGPVNVSLAGMDVNAGETIVDGAGGIVIEVDTGLVRSHTAKQTKTVRSDGRAVGQKIAVRSTVQRERSQTVTRLREASTNGS